MRICLIDENNDRLAALASKLGPLVNRVQQIRVPQAIYLHPPAGLDAIFMTLPAAEKWCPDFKSRQMQVLRTTAEEQTKGFPRFVITGVNLQPEDPRDPLSQIAIVLTEAIAAANDFTKRNAAKIERLGFWVMDLTRGVSIGQAAQLIRTAISSEQFG